MSPQGPRDGAGLSEGNLVQSIFLRGPLLAWSGFCLLSLSKDVSLFLADVLAAVSVLSFEKLEWRWTLDCAERLLTGWSWKCFSQSGEFDIEEMQ